jgi:hypothetical protein
VQVGVVPASREQFSVAALFGDGAVLNDKDAIRVADGRYAMGNKDGGAVMHHLGETAEDTLFGQRVDARQSVIKDKNRRVAQDGLLNSSFARTSSNCRPSGPSATRQRPWSEAPA